MTEEKQLPATTEKPVTQLPSFSAMDTGITKATEKIEMQRATAQVYAAYQMAMHRPRDEQRCYDRIINLCKNVSFAADALYKVPRGNQKVEGFTSKSIKEFSRIFGNMEAGYIEHGSYGPESQFEAAAIDLESNFRFFAKYTVRHERWVNKRIEAVIDPQQVDEICKAKASKQVRNCSSSILPDYMLQDAEKEVRRTLFAAVSDIPGAWKGYVALFEKLNIKEDWLWAFVNKRPDKDDKFKNLKADDIVELKVLASTVKETGEGILNEYFPMRKKGTTTEAATEAPKSSSVGTPAEKSKPSTTPETKTEPPTKSSESTKEESASQPPSEEQKADPKPATSATDTENSVSESAADDATENATADFQEPEPDSEFEPSADEVVEDMF